MQASEPTQPSTGTNWFNIHAPAPFKSNRRLGVRFIRDDIDVSVQKNSLFDLRFGTKSKQIPVQLIDISSKGVLIATDVKLQVNKKLLLTLRFVDLREFQMFSTIVRKTNAELNLYGIKFDQIDSRLADYLLVTQKKLTFK